MASSPTPPPCDQVGPITRDVTDSAVMLNAVSGYDPKDSTSLNLPVSDYGQAGPGREGIEDRPPREYFIEGLDPGREEDTRPMPSPSIRARGGVFRELRPPPYRLRGGQLLPDSHREASSNLARTTASASGHRAAGAKGLQRCSPEPGMKGSVRR